MIEFKTESRPEIELRFKDISPIKMLALQTSIDFNDFDKTAKLFSFILENTQTNISGTWTDLKLKDREVYLPQGIEKDLPFLMEVCTKFLNDVVKPIFTKSRG